jgi:hypothetical protein
MRALLIAIVLSTAGGAICAQPANERVKSFESCFQAARAADAICYSPASDAVERLNCLQKARTAQLECLEHVAPGISAGSAAREMPSITGPPPETPPVSAGQRATSPKTPPGLERPSATNTSDNATGAISPARQSDTHWLVSETVSPVDYSPLVTAVIRSTSTAKNAPSILVIRCRGSRTDLLVRTEGAWRASRAKQVQVDYQVDDQPSLRLAWARSADGKTATYKGDAVELLRSLSEGAALKISVFDRPGPGNEATFQLAGLDAVRKKIAFACKWPPTAGTLSSGKR